MAQARRMLRDGRVRGLADRVRRQLARLPPVRGAQQRRSRPVPGVQRRAAAVDVRGAGPVLHGCVQNDRPVREFLDGKHTFVNAALARHYGMPAPEAEAGRWVRVDDAGRYGRGGLLPMAVFLTKNSPGLRTSPVKRGYWVVRRLLGENIPAPPAERPRTARRRGQARRADPARDAGPPPRRQELRRLPRAVRRDRPGVRGLRARRRGPRTGPRRPARRHPGDVPRRRRGDGPRGPARLSRTHAARGVRRQPLPQAAGLRAWAELDPLGRRDGRRHARAAERRRRPLRRPGRDDRHEPAIPEQANRRRQVGVIAMPDVPMSDQHPSQAAARRPAGRSCVVPG